MQECKKVWTQVWRKIQQEDYIRHVDVDESALPYSNKYSMSVVRNADLILKSPIIYSLHCIESDWNTVILKLISAAQNLD